MSLSTSRLSFLGALTLAVGLAACNNDPGAGKVKAEAAPAEPVAEEKAADSAQAEPAPDDSQAKTTYAFNNEGSKVTFVGAKVTRKHDGGFESFRGTIDVVDGDPVKSSVKAEIDADSIVSDEEKLTTHLKSPDFFDVEKYPKVEFTSTKIEAGGEEGATHTVTGNLNMHGVNKSITFPATIKIEADGVDVDAEFAIDRKDFEITYPGMPDDLIKDNILVKLDIRGQREGAGT